MYDIRPTEGFLDRSPGGRVIPCLNENWARNGRYCRYDESSRIRADMISLTDSERKAQMAEMKSFYDLCKVAQTWSKESNYL